MPTTLHVDNKQRVRITALQKGDIVAVEQQGPDIFLLRRMKPADHPQPKVVRIKGQLFSSGGKSITNEDVRSIIEEVD